MMHGETLRRFSFLRLMARWLGHPTASDLQEGFDLSSSQAYRVLLAAKEISDLNTGDARAFLNLLRGQSLADALQPGLGLNFGIVVEDVDALSAPPLPDAIASELLHALRCKKAVFIAYTGRKGTSERLITPKHLVYVLDRYHLRGWDHAAGGYRDFVLGRIIEAKISSLPAFAPHDAEWAEWLTLRFLINQELPMTLREALATEWDLSFDGIQEISCRRAHARYVVRRMTKQMTSGLRRWIPYDETCRILALLENDVAQESSYARNWVTPVSGGVL